VYRLVKFWVIAQWSGNLLLLGGPFELQLTNNQLKVWQIHLPGIVHENGAQGRTMGVGLLERDVSPTTVLLSPLSPD
jgi:hypothetical protein